MDRLGFPKKTQQGLENDQIFRDKTIKILNYDGQMTTLEKQREYIESLKKEICGLNPDIQISTNKKISLAYLNDFKTQLY